jgi:acetoin utilization deacetylase AcuC-like enzyme
MTRTVWFNPEQTAHMAAPHPSADKGRMLVERWTAEVPHLFRLKASGPIDMERVKAVHDPRYVDRVMSLQEDNGYGTRDTAVVQALPYVLGSIVGSAIEASVGGALHISCAATTAFQDAGYGYGGSYCTFNGLALAAHMVLASHLVDWVAIVDCSRHHGAGTEDILRRVKMPGRVLHWSAGSPENRDIPAERFHMEAFRFVRQKLPLGRGLVLYQAGADMHVNDPLGGRLNSEQMKLRDMRVFHAAGERGIPVCWCPAGGYQRDAAGTIRPVLDLHTQTLWASHEYP